MAPPPVIVVSNRGPVSFAERDGQLVATHGAGGLASALGASVQDLGVTWIAAALSDGDRKAAAGGLTDVHGIKLRLLDIEPHAYRAYYDTVANASLWYVYHGLFDRVHRPVFDRRWHEAWQSYRDVNAQFARAVVEEAPADAVVLVHDYHLALLGGHLAEERPDVRAVHFHHTPFANPDEMRMLPDAVAEELLTGLAAHRACGFHVPRWANAFDETCRAVLGTAPPTFASTAAPNLDEVREAAASAECDLACGRLAATIGGRALIVRNDRIELSKNILRGFHAYDELLATRPEWRGNVVFAAHIYPSRQSLPDYQAYRAECEGLVARINARWGTDGWTPIFLTTEDDFPHAMATLRLADVLLVNPVRDGLNLVAKEGVTINERDAVLVLSREAGVWDELAEGAIGINPFDVGATADALHRALSMDSDERRRRATLLREAAARRSPHDWFNDQLQAAL
jgi:trehalose 6-phosphate synthase